MPGAGNNPITLKLTAELEGLARRARDYADQAKSKATRRAYQSDWRHFESWCQPRGLATIPTTAGVLIGYLTAHAGKLSTATLQRRLAAIREAHRYAGLELDTAGVAFRDAWRGIRRVHGRPTNKKSPLATSMLRRAIALLPNTLIGKRDRALLLVGFAGALRRSELVGLMAAPDSAGGSWIEQNSDGLVIHLGKTKTDQEGAGAGIGIPYGSSPDTCPVRAYRAWLGVAGIAIGRAFRSVNRHGGIGQGLTDQAVTRIVKRAVVRTALADGRTAAEAAAMATKFAGHSLRAGLATSAAANDAPGHAIQRQLRHRKFDTTAGYIRMGRLFKQNAAGMAGL